MTRIAKLYAAVLANPRTAISSADFERLLRAVGFVHVRTTGSQRHHKHPNVPEILTVLPAGKGVKPYQVHRFLELVTTYGLSVEQ